MLGLLWIALAKNVRFVNSDKATFRAQFARARDHDPLTHALRSALLPGALEKGSSQLDPIPDLHGRTALRALRPSSVIWICAPTLLHLSSLRAISHEITAAESVTLASAS